MNAGRDVSSPPLLLRLPLAAAASGKRQPAWAPPAAASGVRMRMSSSLNTSSCSSSSFLLASSAWAVRQERAEESTTSPTPQPVKTGRGSGGCPLRSAAGCHRSSAAQAPRGCLAAPSEVVCSVPAWRVAHLLPASPPPSSGAVRCGGGPSPAPWLPSAARDGAMPEAGALAALQRLPRVQPWLTAKVSRRSHPNESAT